MRTKLRLMCMAMGVLLSTTVWADETITVTANDNEISAQLDLKAVASVFAEAANLEDFEKALNDPENHISNLDLNGDGDVDYLRVIETTDNNRHLIILQAVLAKDIFQDVASIFVEKDEQNQVVMQIIGDEYIYGTNYIIEPVFLTRPLMYDYLFFYHDPWFSPYYWDFYPPYWYHYHCWHYYDYWYHIYAYHHCHPYHSFRHPVEPRPHYQEVHHAVAPTVSRRDFATRHPEQSFTNRNAGRQNAAGIQPTRSEIVTAARTTNTSAGTSRSASTNVSRTFDSTNLRSASATRISNSASTSTSRTPVTTSRPTTTTTSRGTGNLKAATTKTTSTTTTRPTSTSTTTTRPTSTSTTTTRPTSTSTTVRTTTNSSSVRSTTPIRSTSSTSVRSSSTSVRSSGSSFSGGTSSSSSTSSSGSHSGGGGRR